MYTVVILVAGQQWYGLKNASCIRVQKLLLWSIDHIFLKWYIINFLLSMIMLNLYVSLSYPL